MVKFFLETANILFLAVIWGVTIWSFLRGNIEGTRGTIANGSTDDIFLNISLFAADPFVLRLWSPTDSN